MAGSAMTDFMRGPAHQPDLPAGSLPSPRRLPGGHRARPMGWSRQVGTRPLEGAFAA